MMEVAQSEDLAVPKMEADLGEKREEGEREKLLAATSEDAKHNGGKTSHFDSSGNDTAVRNGSGGGSHLEVAPTNEVTVANR